MKMLIIEDEPATSSLLAATLMAHHYGVDVITDGAAGLEMAIQWNYDLILLDILLPKLDGIEVCRRLRAQGCQTPILMLTSQNSNEAVIAGLDAGADDYVAKSCDHSQLLARVRALLRRADRTNLSPILTWGTLCLDPALAQVTYAQKPLALRPKEYRLLELFLRHPQRIHSRSSIIDHLWSLDETPVEGSVTNLIKDLRQRLKAAGMTLDLIETVYGLGYRLKPAPQLEDSRLPDVPAPDAAPVATALLATAPMATAPMTADWTPETADRQPLDPETWQRGMAAIQSITERFRLSLSQRLGTLETTVQALQAGSLQQTAIREQAHKLAGGLSTFGYDRAARIAQAMERLVEEQEVEDTNQLTQLLQDLRRELMLPVASRQQTDAQSNPSIQIRPCQITGQKANQMANQKPSQKANQIAHPVKDPETLKI